MIVSAPLAMRSTSFPSVAAASSIFPSIANRTEVNDNPQLRQNFCSGLF
jgi:hypothetical protein